MERKIGSKFEYEGVTLEVLEGKRDSCEGCYFGNHRYCRFEDLIYTTGLCSALWRKDKKDIIFRQIG